MKSPASLGPSADWKRHMRSGGPKQRLAFWLSLWWGCGFMPRAPGTAGSLGALPLYALASWGGPFVVFAVGTLVTVLGIWSSGEVARTSRASDPQVVVIDEVAGVLLTLAVAPEGWPGLVTGFVLFRFFDQVKPWPLRRFESLPGGFGIMMDDVAAAVFAGTILLALQWLHVL